MKKLFTLFIAAAFFSFSARAQVFPYYEAFDSYTAPQPINGVGGFGATSHVMIEPHGVVGNGVEFQMATAGNDTLNSPLIGPLTANTATSFYFRVVQYVGGSPVHYTMTGGDQAIIYVANPALTFSVSQYTINSANQNTGSSYVKVVVPAPAFVNGIPGRFQIVAFNPNGHNWLLELDSLVVRDTLVIHPTLSATVVNSNCRGDSTGSITIHATGATPPYTYAWNTGATDSFITHLAAGAYSVTVTDSLGATTERTDTVFAPQYQLLLDSLTHNNASCFGGSSGDAAIYPRGGTPAYTYAWSTSPVQQTQQAQNLPAGNYSVTVTDANGCSVTATTQIGQPPLLMLSVTATGATGSNGTATAIANGGTTPFSYQWTPGGQTSAIITGLAPDCYIVVVTDAQGCTVSDSACVANLLAVGDIAGSTLALYPNPASSQLYITIDGSGADATVAISDLSGRIAAEGTTKDGYINVSTLSTGIYTVRVQTSGHSYIRKISIQR